MCDFWSHVVCAGNGAKYEARSVSFNLLGQNILKQLLAQRLNADSEIRTRSDHAKRGAAVHHREVCFACMRNDGSVRVQLSALTLYPRPDSGLRILRIRGGAGHH